VQGMYDELHDFCEAVFADRQPSVGTLEFALQVMRVYEAALLSHGQPVAVASTSGVQAPVASTS